MIAGATGSVAEEHDKAHQQEEECLFFVAMSRARTRLCLYLTRLQRNGRSRSPSPFIARVASKMRSIDDAPTLPGATQSRPTEIQVAFSESWCLTDRRIGSYERCPRRFFYTHILSIGTARRSTSFERTHSCIYELIDWLTKTRLDAVPTREETHAAFDGIWAQKGPTDPAYAAEYRDLARKLVDGLVDAGAGRRFREAKPLAIDFANGRILIEPAEIAERADGVVVVRRIRSGHRGKTEFEKLEYFLYQAAATKHFGGRAVIEAIHLTDNEVVDAPALKPNQAKTGTKKTEELLAGIRDGVYSPKPNAFTCPRCPHFFICAAAPDGTLTAT
jgi:hypothetical protein